MPVTVLRRPALKSGRFCCVGYPGPVGRNAGLRALSLLERSANFVYRL